MRFGFELVGGEHDGNKHQQPEKWVVADFFEQRMHGNALSKENDDAASGRHCYTNRPLPVSICS